MNKELLLQIEGALQENDRLYEEKLIAQIPAVEAKYAELREVIPKGIYFRTHLKKALGNFWFTLIYLSPEERIKEIKKAVALAAQRRNLQIEKKLSSLNIKTIARLERATDSTTFEGYWKLGTDQGEKILRIETIGAGGYNIVAYHQRTLVHVYK